MRTLSVRRQPGEYEGGLEPARVGYHKIVADILRRAPAEDAARIAWHLVSGSQVAQRTTVLELKEGVLRVRVPDNAWRRQLSEFAPQYLERIASVLSAAINHIEFVPEDKKAPHRA